MALSAALSIILYSLAFFRLRGNITVSAGYRLSFHHREQASHGTNMETNDRHIELYLTTVAKHMLWYPIVYTVLVLPVAISRLSTFSGRSIPFSVTIFTAAVFMFHGLFNTVLFCTTRAILPGSWRQRFGLGTAQDIRRGDARPSNRTNETWFTGTRMITGTAPASLSIDMKEGVESKYNAEPSSPTSPTLL